jgi:alpha-tubulin suppressor-like RCC1 family protein
LKTGQTSSPKPVAVLGLRAVTGISACGSHTCANLDDGNLFYWGNNAFGQLGDGSVTSETHPTPVRNL